MEKRISKQSSKLEKGQQLVKCTKCSRVTPLSKLSFQSIELKNTEREIAEGAKEVGVLCPNCNTWTRSYYLNRELEGLQKALVNRHERRKYKTLFTRYNRKMKKKYDSLSNKSNQSQKDEHSSSQDKVNA